MNKLIIAACVSMFAVNVAMAEAPAAPAPPEIEVERTVRLDELPVAQTELEPPYRIIIHNDDRTNHI